MVLLFCIRHGHDPHQIPKWNCWYLRKPYTNCNAKNILNSTIGNCSENLECCVYHIEDGTVGGSYHTQVIDLFAAEVVGMENPCDTTAAQHYFLWLHHNECTFGLLR